jgi:hypothetical protein
MEAEEGRIAPASAGKRTGPSAAVAELTAAAESEPKPIELEPGTQSRWLKPLSAYERKETTIVEGLRYG